MAPSAASRRSTPAASSAGGAVRLRRMSLPAAPASRSCRLVLACIGIGLLSGFLSGLFGVGGGTVIVPLLVLLLGFDQRRAAGTSLAAIVPTSAVGVISYAVHGSVAWIPALLLAFCVWMVWSVVVAKLPSIGFDYSTNQLFWLAALPGLSGATLRIFYSFMVPIFGGRLWTTLSTASLLLPAMGIGYAVQNPETPYSVFVIIALLCGFGGGNFASSMSNISFFYPKAQQGTALGLNAGLGNLGVSAMQFLVPLVIFQITGDVAWSGLAFFFETLPRYLTFPVA
ncbi:TSUP family transporter, partial [uncultured Microbacterium sp.]|uniref:TSUP family transporter n=1 Tax=uncultured Microbacterium sp. TaxID=191216 RepID=UPI0032B18392